MEKVMIVNRYGIHGSRSPTGRLSEELGDDLSDRYGMVCCGWHDLLDAYPRPIMSLWTRLRNDCDMAWKAWKRMRTWDGLMIVMTDPPLLPIIAALSGTRFVVWLQDVYPDIAVKAGVIPEWLAKPIRWAMKWALRRAEKVVVIGRCMQAHLRTWGIESEVIPNWVDGQKWPFVEPQGYKRAYLGRAGVVHGYKGQTVTNLDDAAFLKACQDTHTHVVTLRPEMLGLSVPSKVYAALACGRYVEWHGPMASEAYLIAKEAGATRGIRSPKEIRRFFEEQCDRKVQTEKWWKLLCQLSMK